MKIKTYMIIDCSGSMQLCSGQVTSGVAEYAHDMKDGDWLSITEFEGDIIRQPVTKASKKDMGSTPYRHSVGGRTNLYDAVGKVLTETLKKKNMKGRVLVITTDGYENASTEFKKDHVKSLIAEFEKRGGMAMYLSASTDPFADAMAMGIDASKTASYSVRNTQATYSAATDMKERLRSGEKDVAFTAEARAELNK